MGIYRRKGTRIWTMDFIFNGQRIFESTGMASKVKAQDVFERRKSELKDGAAGIVKKQRPLLLKVAAEAWQQAKQPKWSPKMKQIAQYALDHLLPVLGGKLLVDIDADDIAAYQEARLNESASNRTANIEVGVLRQIMKKHGAWERIKASDAWQDTGMLEERDDAGHALTAAEERVLLHECGQSVSRGLLPFVVLLLQTGARYNTIRTLQWHQVNFEECCIKIGKDKTQAGSGRVVPLNKAALKMLKLWARQFPNRKPMHYVFCSEAYGLHGTKGQAGKGGEVKVYDYNPAQALSTIKTAWQSAKKRTRRHCPKCKAGRLLDKAKPENGYVCHRCGFEVDELPLGLVDLRLHDLRHSAVSRMVAARVPLTTIAKIVGWSTSTTIAMAARYSHPEDSEKRKAVEAISSFS